MINGISDTWATLTTTISNLIQDLLDLMPNWLQNILGVGGGLDASGLGTASGGVAGTGTGTLTSTATENYYNYYYGPVYFGGTGQTNGGVDCQSPNPALSALSPSLPPMGVA